MKLILKWLICLGALAVIAYGFTDSVTLQGGFGTLAIAATILFLVNLLVRPLLQLVSLPVTLLTFGLFALVVNALMVSLTDALLPAIRIHSFWLNVLAALLISAGNTVLLKGRR